MGIKRGTTLLRDNKASGVNYFHASNVYSGMFGSLDLNLFGVDNVSSGGWELAYNLRARCCTTDGADYGNAAAGFENRGKKRL